MQKNRTEDIRMIDVLRDIWSARVFMIAGILVGVALAAAFIGLSVPHKKISIILAPASPIKGADMSSFMGDDNLFALRFIVERFGGTNASDFSQFENIYDGVQIASLLMKDPRIQQGLNQDQSWVFISPRATWTPEELSEYMKRRISIGSTGVNNLRQMSYLHPDAAFGKYFLGTVHRLADQIIRARTRKTAQERVRYLNAALTKTLNAEHRRALTTLLLEQERLLMLVSIDQSYAAQIIEKPFSSAKQAWPNLPLVVSVFIFVGTFFGFVVYGIKSLPRLNQTGVSKAGTGKKLDKWYSDSKVNENKNEKAPHRTAAE